MSPAPRARRSRTSRFSLALRLTRRATAAATRTTRQAGGGVDAAGLEEHSSDSSNEEPAADLKGYISRCVIISWDLYGGPPGVIYAWAHRGAHVYEHHVNYDDTRQWHALGNYGAGRPRGDAAAGALSTGAIKIESTGRPPYDAAAGALSAGAIKIKSKCDLLGQAAASALSAGAIIKLESTGRPPDNAAPDTLSAGANELESKCGLLGHAAADALSTGRQPGGVAAGGDPLAHALASLWPSRRRRHLEPHAQRLPRRARTRRPGLMLRSKPRTEPGGGRVTYALYVDDARLYNNPTPAARELAGRVQSRLKERFEIKFGETNPEEDYFLGANCISHGPHAPTTRCDTYIGSMVERYLPGVDAYSSSKRFPGSYGDTPTGADLTANYEAAVTLRPEPTDKPKKRYGLLFGALLHAIKWRPEVSATLGLCGTCLTICTEELYANLERVLVYLVRTVKANWPH